MQKNIPYTRDMKPFLKEKGFYPNPHPNRKVRRQRPGRPMSNKKGTQLVVVKIGRNFSKWRKQIQYRPGKSPLIHVIHAG